MKLYFREMGEGRPVVILHGLFGSSDNWLTIGKELANDYKVYLVDQRNHGQSPHSDTWNYEAMVEDLKKFLADEVEGKPILVGHSMGGKVVMNFVCQYPDLYDAFVVVDISPREYPVHHDGILEGLCDMKLEEISSRREADEALASAVPQKGVRQFLLKNLGRDGDQFKWKINLEVIKHNIEIVTKGLDKDQKSSAKALFIGGENSDYIQDEDKELIKKHFENAHIIHIKNAGHWVHAEQPEVFLESLSYFLKNV
ncbi:MAG: alpha/beta fold hydrolase [Cyclobacteriaceae bacterium]|nr:alpha/beta fold hydrolase [Cyclobacteriaceae bacterium]MCH8515446.1 alpha/beta fold hydrolase [Cyclobacteriaceae bacterium]